MTARDAAQAELEKALAAHRAALDDFAARALRVEAAAWARPPAEGKWSPAEITEHLRLSLDAVCRELSGGPAMRPMVPAAVRTLLRWRLLPRILRNGRVPKARAPREARPAAPDLDAPRALQRLAEELARFESACRACDRSARISHPYFGRLTLSKANRLLAVHARHHAAQVP